MLDLGLQIIPGGLSTLAFWSLIVLSFFTSALTAAVGIGGGVTLLAIMANMMPPTAVIPVHAVVQMGSNIGRFMTLLSHVDWRMIGWFSLGSLAGAWAGGELAMAIPGAAIQVAMGAFILYSAWLPTFNLPASRRSIIFLGAGTSTVSMIVGGVGPFIYVVIKNLFTDRRGVVATLAAMNTVQQILRAGFYGLLGFVFTDWWWFIALMITTGFAGTLTGKQFLERISAEQAKPVLTVILTILSLRLLYLGFTDLIYSGQVFPFR